MVSCIEQDELTLSLMLQLRIYYGLRFTYEEDDCIEKDYVQAQEKR